MILPPLVFPAPTIVMIAIFYNFVEKNLILLQKTSEFYNFIAKTYFLQYHNKDNQIFTIFYINLSNFTVLLQKYRFLPLCCIKLTNFTILLHETFEFYNFIAKNTNFYNFIAKRLENFAILLIKKSSRIFTVLLQKALKNLQFDC